MSGAVALGVDLLETLRSDARLRRLLRVNAAFSSLTGVIGVFAADGVAGALGLDAVWLVRAVGFGLIVFAADLVVVSGLRPSRLRRAGRAVAVADALWVVATSVVIALGAVSGAGAAVLALLALPVGALAITQWIAAAR